MRKPVRLRVMSALVALLLCIAIPAFGGDSGKVRGELRKWHKVTIDFAGPETSETAIPNPFMDYRLDVTFRNSGTTYVVPGYYAADGNAAETSATFGNVWRVHFCPDRTGLWTYAVRFKTGTNIAVNGGGASAGYFDGLTGSFEIEPTDKTGQDHRGKGRLQYVNRRYLRFAETEEYFLKCGADSPENFLAYEDFDGTPDYNNFRKNWSAHVKDWQAGDPTWKGGKGKGIVGAINYLARVKGMNVVSFLTMNIQGDDRNVFPYISDQRDASGNYTRFDCSKLDQWEMVFEHADKLGLYLHFKTQEAENDNLLDGGEVGLQRKLYYRELMARFAHHLALNWNLGEENGQTTPQRVAMTKYFWRHDPYHHNIVIHNGKSPADLLGDRSRLTGYSIQTGWNNVFRATKDWVDRSTTAGKPWVIASDEQNPASDGVITDAEDYWHDGIRRETLWGNLMAGGAGVEYYFGYRHSHSDLTCQDFRSRDHLWDMSRYAIQFFHRYLPFWEMGNDNRKISTEGDFCLYKPGEVYAVYLKNGGTTTLDLSGTPGMFELLWYNPRRGGPLQSGTVQLVNGDAVCSLGRAPNSVDQDWVVLVRPADTGRNYPPGVDAGNDRSVMLPRNGNSVTVKLDGSVSDDGKPGNTLTTTWSKQSCPDAISFGDPNAPGTMATLAGQGVYVLKLTSSDGELTGSDTVTITVEPFSARVIRTFRATEDAYLEGTTGHNNQQLKVEYNRRVSYLRFNVTGLPDHVINATLKLTTVDDPGNGTLRIYRGSHSNWAEGNLSSANAPAKQDQVGMRTGLAGIGRTIEIMVTSLVTGNGIYTVVLTLDKGGNDIWFGSDESPSKPELIVTAEEPSIR